MNDFSSLSMSTGLNSSLIDTALPAGKKVSRITDARWNCGSVPRSVPSAVPSTCLKRHEGRAAVST